MTKGQMAKRHMANQNLAPGSICDLAFAIWRF
jgi:hypothetical protein